MQPVVAAEPLNLGGWQHPEAQSGFSGGRAIRRPAHRPGASPWARSVPAPAASLAGTTNKERGKTHVGGGRRRGQQKGDTMLIANISFLDLPRSRFGVHNSTVTGGRLCAV